MTASFQQRFRSGNLVNFRKNTLHNAASPGNPEVSNVDKEKNIAIISIALSGDQTQKAFEQSCDLYNVEVKNRKYNIPGFRPGAKLPANYLFQMFGEDTVKLLCAKLLSEDIQIECDKTGLTFVGRGRIVDFKEKSYFPGKEHVIEIECDLWPTISYDGRVDGYKGLDVSVQKGIIFICTLLFW